MNIYTYCGFFAEIHHLEGFNGSNCWHYFHLIIV